MQVVLLESAGASVVDKKVPALQKLAKRLQEAFSLAAKGFRNDQSGRRKAVAFLRRAAGLWSGSEGPWRRNG